MILVANLVNTTGEFIITKTFIAKNERLYPQYDKEIEGSVDMYTQEWVDQVKTGKRERPSELTADKIVVIEDATARSSENQKAPQGLRNVVLW